MADALLRHWTLLKLIPRAPRTADVSQLLSQLADAGHTITRRQLQRDLNTLSTLFPITADDRNIPYGWSWSKDAPAFDLPRMDGTTALSVKLLEQFIPQLLPPRSRTSCGRTSARPTRCSLSTHRITSAPGSIACA